MITIQIDGKTYKQSDGSKEWIINSIIGWTKDGSLEEVKENKDQPVYDAGIGAYINSKGDVVDHSIIEKLREFVEELEKCYEDADISGSYSSGVQMGLNYALDFLTSLESQEEEKTQKTYPYDKMIEYLKKHGEARVKMSWGNPTVYLNDDENLIRDRDGFYDEKCTFEILEEEKETEEVNYCDSRTDEERARDEELYRTSVTTSTSTVWQPTPGQLIEVSNDEKKWYPGAKFSKYDENDEYPFIVDGDVPFVHWKYARPQQIREVIVPEFDWGWVMKQLEENQKLNLIPFTALAVMATHIGALDKWQKSLQKHPLFNK